MSIDLFKLDNSQTISVVDAIAATTYQVEQDTLQEGAWTIARKEIRQLMAQLVAEHTSLEKFTKGKIWMGVKSGLTKAFVIDSQTRQEILSENPETHDIIKPFLNGRKVCRFQLQPKDLYLIYTYHGVDIRKYPAIEAYLKPFKEHLIKRATRQEWYELQQPQYKFSKFMESPKIVFPDIATVPIFSFGCIS